MVMHRLLGAVQAISQLDQGARGLPVEAIASAEDAAVFDGQSRHQRAELRLDPPRHQSRQRIQAYRAWRDLIAIQLIDLCRHLLLPGSSPTFPAIRAASRIGRTRCDTPSAREDLPSAARVLALADDWAERALDSMTGTSYTRTAGDLSSGRPWPALSRSQCVWPA